VKGAEEYAKGWIECFHAYQGLGPPDTHWPIEKFQKYSVEDFEKDVFREGHVDVGVFQSTYLKEWNTSGFNTIEGNAPLLDRFPGKLILNGRWDPREGEAGLRQLEADHAKYGIQGVKLYTAEWYKGSRGWKLTDPEAVPFLDKCVELGIKNIHVHKGPTIWPLDKDSFDVSDIDHVATDYQELNFIVEHVGLPRIEDFCFMATQERNVYAGLAVVIGGLMHARPRFFAKVMGELLFWVGEDKMLFGSDYAIWEPKWQVEGFVDWEMPDHEDFSDYPRLGVAGKKKILGLNGAKLYGIEVPEELRLPVPAEEPASPESAVGVPG
jgi:predicted TIM-barrel fold metal-dependent hydrolase